MHNLDFYKNIFNGIGWFIPPYVTMGYLQFLAGAVQQKGAGFNQKHLEESLSHIYSPQNLAAMVLHRYPIVPHVMEYKKIISEAVEAHFAGLDHVAVGGLLPTIEGIGIKLAESRSVTIGTTKQTFKNLAINCKEEVIQKNIGAVGEIISMLESFVEFTNKNLYVSSKTYPLSDNTNRHGILHGSYTDKDYGAPINFYKVIASIDFLCFISATRASISCFAPSPTDESNKLALYYQQCAKTKKCRPIVS